ncbi:MAG: VCBS repeat-containing protein [bacterium]|nr:VCBS repeat-containing protein [bacterium]
MSFFFLKKSIVLVGLVGLIFALLFIKSIPMATAQVVAWTAKSAWNAPDVGGTSVPAFADLDNDGDYDLLIGEEGGVSYAYENTGSNTSPTWTAKPVWNAPDVGEEAAPAFADLDNDGDYDLLIGEHFGSSAAYENTGSKTSPTWTAKPAWSVPDVGFMVRPAFADLDNDGDYDLMIGGNSGGTIGVSYAYENTGSKTSPTWTAKPAWDAPNVADLSAPAFADLNNDGDYDLLIGKYDGLSVAYKNTGSKTSPTWIYESAWDVSFDVGYYARPAFADLDNDGDYDLLIGTTAGISFAYENTGSPPPTCTLSASPASIVSGDSSVLTWTTANATSATIDNSIGSVTPVNTGGINVSPAATTTYIMTATGSGTSTCQTIINVSPPPPPPTGGLVPCGRLANAIPASGPDLIDESAPCTLCALFYMLKNIINFVMTLSVGIGVFILVIAGLLYAFSAGNPGKISLAKSAVTSAIIGIAIIFIAWMAIAVILQGMGYANMATWNQVNCTL